MNRRKEQDAIIKFISKCVLKHIKDLADNSKYEDALSILSHKKLAYTIATHFIDVDIEEEDELNCVMEALEEIIYNTFG